MDIQNLEILLRLVIAHVLADFPLQSNKTAGEKKKGFRSKYFWLHILTVGMTTYLFLGQWTNWQAPVIITAIHAAIDQLKATADTKSKWAANNPTWLFIIDQFLHLITLLVYWLLAYKIITDCGSFIAILDDRLLSNVGILIIIIAYLVITMPVGILIGLITKKWQDEIAEDDKKKAKKGKDNAATESLKDAGKTIGMIERLLVLTFVLMQQYQAIGFLFAAKSVFRFGDLKESGQRKRTEYILIGTLLSFIISIVLGLLVQYLVKRV